MSLDTIAIKELIASIRAHFARSDAMLTYADTALDKAIATLENLPIEQLRFKLQGFVCVQPLAPVADIAKCLAGGGTVIAVIWLKPRWPATMAMLQGGLQVVQVTECSDTEAKIISNLPGLDVLTNPGKWILGGALLWVGG